MNVVAWGRRWSLSLFLTGIGAAAIILAFGIPETGFQNRFDPGPSAVPVLIGIFLLAGGIAEGIRAAREAPILPEIIPGDFGIFVGALILYALAMPYTGFGLATVILSSLMTWYLGSRWWVAIALAVSLVVVVHVLFVYLFRVPLPSGVLGLPF